tara:strand:+ start:477 stop:923 length:447 start_codon:yes stop_codon:yes gene_type:complete
MNNTGDKLKLIGNNIEDLKTISAYCQDSVVRIQDIVYLKENKILIIKLKRFMWEDLEKGVFRKYKRIDSYLRFNFIDKVSSKNINQKKGNRNLELLTIKPSFTENNLYETSLIFSGNGVILLTSEIIDIILDDQETFHEVKNFPKHKI